MSTFIVLKIVLTVFSCFAYLIEESRIDLYLVEVAKVRTILMVVVIVVSSHWIG